eukprot:6293006-Amphidinium_carterae.1
MTLYTAYAKRTQHVAARDRLLETIAIWETRITKPKWRLNGNCAHCTHTTNAATLLTPKVPHLASTQMFSSSAVDAPPMERQQTHSSDKTTHTTAKIPHTTCPTVLECYCSISNLSSSLFLRGAGLQQNTVVKRSPRVQKMGQGRGVCFM